MSFKVRFVKKKKEIYKWGLTFIRLLMAKMTRIYNGAA